MRGLKTCLWIAGVACLFGVIGIFLPMSAIRSVVASFGLPAFPDAPLVAVMYRAMAATYVAAGVFLIILALDPMKYGILVPFAGVAGIFVGVVLGVSGCVARMPMWWTASESLWGVLLGVLVLLFWRCAKCPCCGSADAADQEAEASETSDQQTESP